MRDSSYASCIFEYQESDSPTTRTVLSTLAIIVLSIAIEIVVNVRLDRFGFKPTTRTTSSSNTPPTPLVDIQSNLEPHPQASAQESEHAAPKPKPRFWFPHTTSPLVRANRLAAAVLLFLPLIAVFSLRIADIVTPWLPQECRRWMGSGNVAPANLWAMVFVNIIPFVSACFAVARALVDALAVRWGGGVSYTGGGEGVAKWPWMPFFPGFVVFVIMRGVWDAVRWCVQKVMGGEGSVWGREEDDVEMRGELGRGLLDDVDGDSEDEGVDESGSAGLPSYDEVVRPNKRP